MTEGNVALAPLPQADGRGKPRPAILLRQLPPFSDWLLCGVSTQLHQTVRLLNGALELRVMTVNDIGRCRPGRDALVL